MATKGSLKFNIDKLNARGQVEAKPILAELTKWISTK